MAIDVHIPPRFLFLEKARWLDHHSGRFLFANLFPNRMPRKFYLTGLNIWMSKKRAASLMTRVRKLTLPAEKELAKDTNWSGSKKKEILLEVQGNPNFFSFHHNNTRCETGFLISIPCSIQGSETDFQCASYLGRDSLDASFRLFIPRKWQTTLILLMNRLYSPINQILCCDLHYQTPFKSHAFLISLKPGGD